MSTNNEGGRCSRRQALTAAGMAGVGVTALAACSTTSPSSSSSNGSPGGVSAAKGKTIFETSQIPVGGGKINDTYKIVVTQPTAGDFKAFTAICTHMGCTLDAVTGGVIQCPCHGSTFSIKTGAVEAGPAPSPLQEYTVTVNGKAITVG